MISWQNAPICLTLDGWYSDALHARYGHQRLHHAQYAEWLLGAKRSGNPDKHLHLIEALQERLHHIQPWDAAAAEQFSDLQTLLFNAGTPIGTNDTLIAAHALSLQAIMVTNNTRHFDKVPDLRLENWV